jgi:hypothetical protein
VKNFARYILSLVVLGIAGFGVCKLWGYYMLSPWVRLAQRIPVRVQIDKILDGVLISSGVTCTVVAESSQRVRQHWAGVSKPTSFLWRAAAL